jgi:hypothetical protein
VDEAQKIALVHIASIRHRDGSTTGPYDQSWANANQDFGISLGAEFTVELANSRDVKIRVLTVNRPPQHMPGAVSVVPTITAEEI